ncbi:MAG: winged helix-turn-helix transcriptional regulator [Christensenellaceae bacterium]|nr:winged helix-turn-helix transcriptional regulator [Christensenellaceae bacterium]
MGSRYFDAVLHLDKMNLVRRMRFYETARDLGVYHGQMPILFYLLDHNGCTQKDIAEELMVTPASIAISTKRMQKSGLIDKQVRESNLRENIVTITDKGKKLVEEWREAMKALDAKQFSGFSDDEIDLLVSMIDRLTINLEGDSDTGRDRMRELKKKVSEAERKMSSGQ